MRVNITAPPPPIRPPPTFSVEMTLDELHDLAAVIGKLAGPAGIISVTYTALSDALESVGVAYDPARAKVTVDSDIPVNPYVTYPRQAGA